MFNPLLVMESKGLQAAACMVVRAGTGSFFDPAEALAHFLEHILFLGSDRFPEENVLDNYFDMHEGDSSACTCDNHTVYYLFVTQELLESALEMFSRPFIVPFMKPDSMNQEIEAIASGFWSTSHSFLGLCKNCA